jgi:tetratricopeptide (TPR) repeat protein
MVSHHNNKEIFKTLRQMFTSRTKEAHTYFLLGSELYEEGKVEQAIGFFEKAVALRPKSGEYLLMLAMAYEVGGYDERAFECYMDMLCL